MENMAVSIGIDYVSGQWKSCIIDQGHLTEFRAFVTTNELLTFIDQECSFYPEPSIVVSLDALTPFSALRALSAEQIRKSLQNSTSASTLSEISEMLSALCLLSLHSYCAPSVAYLPTVPPHRRLLRSWLGSSREV